MSNMQEEDVQMDGYSSGEEEVARLRAGEVSDTDSDMSDIQKKFEGDDDEDDDDLENQNGMESDSGSDSDSSVEEDENGELTRVTKETYIPAAGQADEELEVDEKYYKLLYKATTTFPCMSFDVIPDNLGDGEQRANTFPAALSLVGGTYSGKKGQDSLLVMKFSKLQNTKNQQNSSDDDEDEKDESKQKLYEGTMRHVSIPHAGGVNRIRTTVINDNVYAASWSESKAVHFWDITKATRAVKSDRLVNSFDSKNELPLFSFRGHPSDGFALDWSTKQPGYLASGDCLKFIYVYTPTQSGKWEASGAPLLGHSNSVEDIQWSPNEPNIFASCSVDRSIRIWDIRSNSSMLNVPNAHKSDVNVISWNPLDPVFLLSGGDDHAIRVWDMRQFGRGQARPIATFAHHTAPITSVEWSSHDSTTFAASGEDNQITIWDLSVEKDESEANANSSNDKLKSLPPQLLFIHQGQKEIKELHWHKQMPGFIISTALSGFDIFKTINI